MRKIAIILFSLSSILCSCHREHWGHADQQIVVDGWIDSGATPVVMVTSTVNPSSEFRTIEELRSHILKWAKVTLTSPDTTVVLVGSINKNYFPPYIFTTSYIKGVPGQRYDLKVEYGGETVTASTTVPQSEALIGLEAQPVKGYDDCYTIVAKMGPKPSERRFYRFFTKVEGEDDYFHATFPGAFDSSNLKENAEITLTKGYSIDGRHLNSHFKKGDTVYIKFCTMDEPAWRFWSDLDRICSLGKAVLFPTYENPSSNIAGGLGYWAGYGTTYYSINL
ncbi:MAG: DUF4249 family protein [Bacteroidales bacterium]|nr:DUF4249 family protein [Bacteroidales bacterium]